MKKNIQSDEIINVRTLIGSLTKHWQYFIFSFISILLIAGCLIYFIPPKYSVTSSILIRTDSKTAPIIENYISGTELFKRDKNLENEQAILTSYSLIYQTIKDLNYTISYYAQDGIKTVEVYKKLPVEIILDSSKNQVVNCPITLTEISPGKYHVIAEGTDLNLYNPVLKKTIKEAIEELEINDTINIGEQFKNEYLTFSINKIPGRTNNEDYPEFSFVINDLNIMAEQYRKDLVLLPVSKESSILKISQLSTVPEKEIDFQSSLINNYILNDLNEKRQIATNTIAYIDSQLEGISDSLHLAEGDLEKYRAINTVIDLSYEGKSLFDKYRELETEKSKEVFKERYYDYLLSYLTKNKDINSITAPSTIGIMDPLLNNLVNELMVLNNEKAAVSYSTKNDNPYIAIANLKIDNIKKTLTENLVNIKSSSQIAFDNVNKRMLELHIKMQKLPSKERGLLNIQRRFSLNDQTYNFLVQKRTEASIAQFSNIKENRVIDYPKVSADGPVSPNPKLIIAISLILGFIFPIALIFAKSIFSDNITNKDKLIQSTDINILSIITLTNSQLRNSLTSTSASDYYKNLRLKLSSRFQSNPILLIASSDQKQIQLPTAINLAKLYARTNKNILLIECNSGASNLQNVFEVKNKKGFSDLLKDVNNFSLLTQKTTIPNLDIIVSGQKEDSISELAEQPEVAELFHCFKNQYDIVIMEIKGFYNNPLFTVLNRYSDIILLNVSSDSSIKELEELNHSIDESDKNKTSIIYYQT